MGVAVFRSEDVPVAERVDSWQNANGHMIMPVMLGPVESADFIVRMRRTDFGSVSLSTLEFSPHNAARTPALIRRGDPELYMLALGVHGALTMSQAGQDAVLGSGDLMLYDSSLPFHSVVGNGSGLTRTLLLHVPKSYLPLPARSVKGLLARRLPGHEGIGAVVARTLAGIGAESDQLTMADSALLGPVALNLLTALLSHHLHTDPSLPASHHDALLLHVEAFIHDHVSDPQLTPSSVAAAHHVSTRSLQRMFQQRGTTVAAFIRQCRLDGARRDLADPALAARPIHATATRWGFTRPADFTRAFRAAFGVSPSDYRAAVLHGRDVARR